MTPECQRPRETLLQKPLPGSALGRRCEEQRRPPPGLGRGGEACKPPRNHVCWIGPGRGDGRMWVQVASRHFCLFTVTCGSLVDKATCCSDRRGPCRSTRRRSSRNANTHDLSWRLPAAKCVDQPSHQLDLLRQGGLWAQGLWESSPGRARDPGMGRQTPEPPDPSPAGQQRDKDRPKLRQAGVASSLEPLGRLPAGTDGRDGQRAKIIRMMSPGWTGE